MIKFFHSKLHIDYEYFDDATIRVCLKERGYSLDKKLLGTGSTGIVYSGKDPAGRECAIKVISAAAIREKYCSGTASEKFKLAEGLMFQESQTLTRLNEPIIMRCYDAFILKNLNEEAKYYVLVLEKMVPFLDYMKKIGKFGEADAWLLLCRVCQILLTLDRYHIVHRDIKEDNLFVRLEDAKTKKGLPPLVIGDFGIMKQVDTMDEDHTYIYEGLKIGTPGFASPEQIEAGCKAITTKSDTYSAGMMVLSILTHTYSVSPGTAYSILVEKGYSEHFARLISNMLQQNACNRLSIGKVNSIAMAHLAKGKTYGEDVLDSKEKVRTPENSPTKIFG